MSNSLDILNLLEFSSQQPTYFYKNYVLNSKWLSSTSSFNLPSGYPMTFSQPDFNNYSFQSRQNWPSELYSSLLYKNLSSSYQNPFISFNYQPLSTQDWRSPNLNMPNTVSYIPMASRYMQFLSSNDSYTSAYYPGYSNLLTKYYPKYYPWYSYTTSYYPGYNYPWVPPATTSNQQQSGDVIGTIGIISDVHYTDKKSTDRRFRNSLSGPRFYSEAGDDLADFVSKMNSMGVNAAIELGDFIDIHSGNCLSEGNSNIYDDGAHGEVILSEAESIYSQLNTPYYHVIGNWDMYDYDFATADEWFKYITNGTPDTIDSLGGRPYTDALGNHASRYYSFKFGGVLGIVLDSSGGSLSGDNYLINTVGIEGTGYVPQMQLNWLTNVLADNSSGENMPVIIFIHPFLYPIITENSYYMCKNHSSVRSILEADKNVIAVVNGHHHPGANNWWEDIKDNPKSNVYHIATGVFGEEYNGIKYYNLRGSIIGWGSDSAAPIQKPSNVYYVLTVKKRTSISTEIKTFRTN